MGIFFLAEAYESHKLDEWEHFSCQSAHVKQLEDEIYPSEPGQIALEIAQNLSSSSSITAVSLSDESDFVSWRGIAWEKAPGHRSVRRLPYFKKCHIFLYIFSSPVWKTMYVYQSKKGRRCLYDPKSLISLMTYLTKKDTFIAHHGDKFCCANFHFLVERNTDETLIRKISTLKIKYH